VRIRVAIGALVLALAGLLVAQDDGPSAWELYEEGRAAEKAGNVAEAYLLYMEAAAMDPRNKTYWFRGQAVQSKALMQAKVKPNPSDVSAALPPDDTPPPQVDQATLRDEMDVRKLLPPPDLTVTDAQTRDFDLDGDSQKLWEQMA